MVTLGTPDFPRHTPLRLPTSQFIALHLISIMRSWLSWRVRLCISGLSNSNYYGDKGVLSHRVLSHSQGYILHCESREIRFL